MPTDRLTDVPAEVLAAIAEATGPVVQAEPLGSGFNSEIAARVHTDTATVFVKGLRTDHPRVWTQQREAEINPYVQGVAPRMLWRLETAGWDLLGFEAVDGHHADYAPDSSDVPLVAAALRRLGGVPCPDVPLKGMPDRMAAYTDTPELFAGDRLLHTDWNNTNVLVHDGRALLVDWAWASRGAGWIDPALWVIWLIAGGHTADQAELWAGALPAWEDAPRAAVNAFARASARLWREIAGADPDPWTQRVEAAAGTWARHRGGTAR
ncbi:MULTISPECIES: aminoglycoside phosphotransferase [Streptomyces]|uniref:aminoglycoside phosphotransferase n=1 Tax=Streptomyces TaxID=1883 RepID=UPI002248B606|nr:aminoglycoside phosphotransferase [Streptomyces sp. JHD 1]MCX2967359.1 aminoglycoside phosphotransferase [Streptomyces sp. JHD 1]